MNGIGCLLVQSFQFVRSALGVLHRISDSLVPLKSSVVCPEVHGQFGPDAFAVDVFAPLDSHLIVVIGMLHVMNEPCKCAVFGLAMHGQKGQFGAHGLAQVLELVRELRLVVKLNGVHCSLQFS